MADGDSRPGSATRTRRQLDIDILLPAGVRAPGLARWLQSVAPAGARGSLSVAVISDARVRTLNRRYRGKNANTDVLSFPGGTPHALPPRAGRAPRALGDVVIAIGVARRQARDAGHSLQTELRILALHGLLHLLGYDHEQDDGRMARLERRLRRKGGLLEGLIERTADRPARSRVASRR